MNMRESHTIDSPCLFSISSREATLVRAPHFLPILCFARTTFYHAPTSTAFMKRLRKESRGSFLHSFMKVALAKSSQVVKATCFERVYSLTHVLCQMSLHGTWFPGHMSPLLCLALALLQYFGGSLGGFIGSL